MAASTLSLEEFLVRLRAFLVDGAEAIYSDDSLSESLRQAISDLSNAYGARVVIKDLDGAAATTVDVLDQDIVVRGAAGYAARMRAVNRADSANMGQNMPALLLEWSKNTLYWFNDQVRVIKLRNLQASSSNPASEWTWDESEKNW